MTTSVVVEPVVDDGFAVADAARDLAKIAVVERHLATGRIGHGFVSGSGLDARRSRIVRLARRPQPHRRRHDRTRTWRSPSRGSPRSAAASSRSRIGRILAECPLPIAGLLSAAPLAEVIAQSRACNDAARALGWSGATPFLTLSFLGLSVIPHLKITDRGLVDGDRFEIVPLAA